MAKTELEKLKEYIRAESANLLCETHPNVCELRDTNYPKMESMTIAYCKRDGDPVGVQTAFGLMESELGDAAIDNEEE